MDGTGNELSPGLLIIAATPLGQPQDASARLRVALGSADVVAAEDTRRTKHLANALGVSITGRVVSFYDAVESARLPMLLAQVAAGATVLLVTDAGMPSVSDPGYRLVAACVAQDLAVTCLPGPSAVTTALALSGIACERFCFDGFPPRRSAARRTWLTQLRHEPRACVFFEAPHRIAACLQDAVTVLGGDRRAAVCRELTKTYEEVRRGTLAELAAWAADGVRGEITVVLAGAAPAPAPEPAELVARVQDLVDAGVRLKDACGQVAEQAGSSRNVLYELVLAART